MSVDVMRRELVSLNSLDTVPDIQGPVRSNAEAFLGKKIVACEGATEIGCLRAYDIYKFKGKSIPVWSLSTSYFDSRGAGKIKSVCGQLVKLGYQVAMLCDNDEPDQLSEEDVKHLMLILVSMSVNGSREIQLKTSFFMIVLGPKFLNF